MYKVKNNLSPSIIAELFEQRNENYNLRNNNPFTIPAVRTVQHGSESISFLGPKIWNILPDNIKNAESLNVFKTKIKAGNQKLVHVASAEYMYKMWDLCESR